MSPSRPAAKRPAPAKAAAQRRTRAAPTASASSAAAFIPAGASLAALRTAAEGCRGCELYRHATRTVFGEGPADARIMLVGEAPGDAEDRAGRPFVGPAGALLDRALADAGLERLELYLTNTVKHFSFLIAHGMRLHKKPKTEHVRACRPWLEAEAAVVRPAVIGCLGATAAQAVLRRAVTIREVRGAGIAHRLADADTTVFVTVHPSSLLRIPDRDDRHRAYAAFVGDLKLVRKAAARAG